jgi:AAA domain (Cdc48 subfamily)/C-terminal, D2-small domain, of ClpB protein
VSTDLPPWVRELSIALTVYPQILLTGNVRDTYMLPPADGAGPALAPYGLDEVIERACRERDYGGLAIHDPVLDTMTVWPLRDDFAAFPPGLVRMAEEDAGPARPEPGQDPRESLPSQEDRLRSLLVEVVRHRGPAVGLVFPYAARVGSGDGDQDPAGRRLFTVVEALADTAQQVPGPHPVMPYNTIFWITERQEQMPPEFPVGNRSIRVITIPAPPIDQRVAAARYSVTGMVGAEGDAAAEAAALTLAAETHGMRNTEVLAIGRMALDREIPADRLREAARLYRVGVTDNPWAAATLRRSIADGDEYLNARVIGQPRAVRKTMEIFKRSATGLTGAQAASSPSRPRGVLFLAGPTGVGKTELAKGIATMIFGSDSRPVRFDMSEFAEEHARDRLIGAPPGYVGHTAGGELTNAVRANPMSVLLFDEIDKANPRLYDLFLQILEDGRLTDGRGATVYFTECVLIFTSNLGVVVRQPDGVERRLTRADRPKAVQDALRLAFDQFFDQVIRRPELRNRFGDSFIAMDFIQPESVPEILAKALRSVTERVAEVQGARLELSAAAHEALRLASVTQLDHGGRGVNNTVEAALVNPLATELFQTAPEPGEAIVVESIEPDGDAWHIKVSRCSG